MCRACNVPQQSEGQGREAKEAEAEEVATDPLATDLRHFHPATSSFEALSSGDFTAVRRVASGIHGEVFRYRWAWMGNDGEHVSVKKLRRQALEQPEDDVESDERRAHLKLGGRRSPCQEDALTEIGVLEYLSKQADLPQYLLKMLGVFADSRHVWLVTEFADGGELFEEVSRHGRLPEAQARRHAWETLQAVSYLHRHGIGHRDISLENILLKGGAVRLMDFGMAVQSRAAAGGAALRYFRAVGKDFYRAPECYVPAAAFVDVVAPEGAGPGAVVSVRAHSLNLCQVRLPGDAVPGRRCRAEVWGYEAPPTDVFAVGVCLFTMLIGGPGWTQANFGDDRFTYVHEHGLGQLVRSWGMPFPSQEVEELLKGTLCPDPSRRWSADACLSGEWFAEMADNKVPVHAKNLSAEPSRLRSMAGA